MNKCCQNSYVKNSTLHTPNSTLKNAFTLAEVLITLGIIGVVAALTIPTLIQNHRKHVVETRLEKFYSSINQAIALAENEFGERENWGISSSELNDYEWFNKYLNKYIKTIKVEKSDSNEALVYLSDGSAIRISRLGILFYPEAKNIEYTTNTNPEYSGSKYFAFFYYPENKDNSADFKYVNNMVEPYKWKWDGTENGENGLRTQTVFGCNSEEHRFGASYCTALIQYNGWKIPEDYPFRF